MVRLWPCAVKDNRAASGSVSSCPFSMRTFPNAGTRSNCSTLIEVWLAPGLNFPPKYAASSFGFQLARSP